MTSKFVIVGTVFLSRLQLLPVRSCRQHMFFQATSSCKKMHTSFESLLSHSPALRSLWLLLHRRSSPHYLTFE